MKEENLGKVDEIAELEKSKRKQKRKIKKASLLTIEKISDDLYALLARGDRLEFNGAELYLVDKEVFYGLVALEKKGEMHMESLDVSEANSDFKGKAFNLININETPAKNYRCYTRLTPLIITDKQKVLERLPAEFKIWINVQKALLRTTIEDGNFSKDKIQEMEDSLQEEISRNKQMMKELLGSFDEYEVKISNYETASRYPTVYHYDTKGKKSVTHLSIKKPNVLWVEEEEITEKKRGDASLLSFIKTSQRIGSRVFFKKKQQ